MISPRLAGAIVVQAITFVGPLAASSTGLISGELAGIAAPLLWFSAGLPLSYRVLDRRPLAGERRHHGAASGAVFAARANQLR